jgi:hypothetical protein
LIIAEDDSDTVMSSVTTVTMNRTVTDTMTVTALADSGSDSERAAYSIRPGAPRRLAVIVELKTPAALPQQRRDWEPRHAGGSGGAG